MIENKNILIVGKSSFIAKALRDKLREGKGNVVECISHDENTFSNKPDIVVNFACPARTDKFEEGAFDIIHANTTLMAKLLALAKRANAMFVQISSGSADDSFVVPPDHLHAPYSIGKKFSEMLCQLFRKQFDLDIRICRLYHTYGSGMTLKDGRIHSNAVHEALYKDKITYWGNGLAVRAFCHVDDVVDGIIRAIRYGTNGKVYRLGNPYASAYIKTFCETLGSIVGKGVVSVEGLATDDSFVPDISDTQHDLSWYPKIRLREGLERVIKEIKENGN